MKYADFDLVKNATTNETTGMQEVVVAKLSAMAVLGITSFFLGVLPVKLASCLRWKSSSGHGGRQPLVISLLLCFGGGVLLYTVFMHLQPEVVEQMDVILEAGYISEDFVDTGINLAQLVFCGGFFFVYLIEETVHALLDRSHHAEDMKVLHRSLSLRKGCTGGKLIPRISLAHPIPTPSSTITTSTQALYKDPCLNHTGFYRKSGIEPGLTGITTPAPTEPSESESGLQSERSLSVGKSFRGFLAVVALSFHAVFEGLAVGLEKEASNVWYLCAAIATHKLVIAFCVGVELVSSRTKTSLVILYIAAFALVSPLGIGMGIFISYEQVDPGSASLALPSVILQGMAAGTLLYVVFFEVLQRQKGHGNDGFLQLLAIIAGFVVMLSLGIFIGHHHHHPETSSDHGHHSHHSHDHGHHEVH